MGESSSFLILVVGVAGSLLLAGLSWFLSAFRARMIGLEVEIAGIREEERNRAEQLFRDRDATLKESERALQESEKRFMDVLYASSDAILLISGEAFVDCNEATARMLGYASRQEFLMNHPSRLSPPVQPDGRESFEKANEMMRLAFERGFHRFEWMHRRASGEDFPVEVSLTPIVYKGQNLLHCIWRDLTEHKRAENSQRESEARFKTLFDEARDGLLIADLKTRRFIMGNKAVCEMLQCSRDELLQMGLADVHPPEGFSDIMLAFEKQARGELKIIEDASVKRRNGEVFPADILSTLVSLDGKPCLMANFRDVSERRQAQQALRSSEEHLRTVLDASQDALIVTDRHGEVTLSNHSARKLFSWERSEKHRLIGNYLKEERSGQLAALQKEALLRNVSQTCELQAVRKNGEEFPAKIILASNRLSRAFILWTVRDITVERLNEAAKRQIERIQSIGALASGIAHEINTPAQFVTDNLVFLEESSVSLMELLVTCAELRSLAEQKMELEPLLQKIFSLSAGLDTEFLRVEFPAALGESRNGIGRISEIVRAMKSFAHPGSTEKRPADLNKAIRDTVTVARNEWKYVAEMDLELSDDLPPVPCLIGEFNQVVLNMIVNSAHAIADVKKTVPAGKGRITISTMAEADWAIVKISDTGAGIPEAVQSRIFDPFFTTKPPGSGSGQGLAIAHSVIVEKHQGSITLKSEVGAGTTFTIRLPLSLAPAKQISEGASHGA